LSTIRNNMPPHWTYEKIENDDAPLAQGDILWPGDDLRAVLGEEHPDFCDPKYLAFVVITQSCDLVSRRGKPCKADYVNLTPLRDLESCLLQFLDDVCEKISSGVYLQNSKPEAYQLLARILNQNEQALGLFYLHPDTDTVGISDYAVALLRVSAPVNARRHYAVLQKARKGRLNAQFRSRLGWLVGNLYSRVATPDWGDQEGGDMRMRDLIHQLVDTDLYKWVSKASVNAAKKAGVRFEQIPPEKVIPTLKGFELPPFKEQIAEAASQEVTKVVSRLSAQILEDIDRNLLLKPRTKKTVKAELSKIIPGYFADVPRTVKNRLINNTTVKKAVNREEL